MTSTSRTLQNTWNTAWQTAPPASCATLRNLKNTVAWGETCVFAEEDGDPVPFSVNTACMPWVTSNIYPSASAFYSPATACPASWTAVATQTSGATQWVDGETALMCCPNGYDSDGGSGCRPGSSGTFPVVECGEADAEENSLKTYTGGAWPATATPSITALQLRYQASDTGGSGTSSTSMGSSSAAANSGGTGGLSTGAIAAIATVIPLVLIVGALAAFLLWRRRRHRKAAALLYKDAGSEKSGHSPRAQPYHLITPESKDTHLIHTDAAAVGQDTSQHETPEWNAELDGTEAEQQRLVSPSDAPVSAATDSSAQASELGGLLRVQRKPIAPVEIDGTPIIAEVGNAYIPYRPGV